MPLNLATIRTGAVNGSGQLTVDCNMPNGTLIVIYRGTFWIGEAVLSANVAQVPVLTLARGDVIQASVTERGNQAGPPVQVIAAQAQPTGWRIPQTVDVDGEILTAAEYEQRYGEAPAASYDPTLRISAIVSDIDPTPAGTLTDYPILFDVRIEQQTGSTTVTIQNVVGQQGNPFVRWTPGEAYSNLLTRSFTQAATVTIDVKGEDDTLPTSRTFSVNVFNPPVATPASSDILALSYRLMGGPTFIRACINSLKACECRLEGYDPSWQAGIFYGAGPDYQEASFYPVPLGTYKIWVRVAGDTDASRWKSITISTS